MDTSTIIDAIAGNCAKISRTSKVPAAPPRLHVLPPTDCVLGGSWLARPRLLFPQIFPTTPYQPPTLSLPYPLPAPRQYLLSTTLPNERGENSFHRRIFHQDSLYQSRYLSLRIAICSVPEASRARGVIPKRVASKRAGVCI